LSFFIEGKDAKDIKSLVFEVKVQSRTLRCGPQCAVDKLNAQGFVKAEGRRTRSARSLALERRKELVHSDLDAVRSALITLYLALPQGCLNVSENEDEGLTEGHTWNDNVEHAWITVLEVATHPTEIMECMLVLEMCINKAWHLPTSQTGPILNALPNPHYAIRCTTLSAAALRIFVLDRVLDYGRFISEIRKAGTRSRINVKPEMEKRTAKGRKVDEIEDDQGDLDPLGGRTGRKKPRPSYADADEDTTSE